MTAAPVGNDTDTLQEIAEDSAAIDRAMRALWPALRRDPLGPLRVALGGLIDSRVALDRAKYANGQEDAA